LAAKAPANGRARKDKEIEDEADKVVSLSIEPKGLQAVRLAPGLVPMAEKIAVFKQTGLAFEALMPSEGQVPLHSVFVLWWVGRRQAGEPDLTLEQADREWTKAGIASVVDVKLDAEVDSPEG